MRGVADENLTPTVRTLVVLRPALVVLIGALIVSALMAIVIVVQGDFGDLDGKVLGTAGALAGFTLLSLPSLVHLERRRHVRLAAVGGVVSLASFAMLTTLIWGFDLFRDTSSSKTLGTLVIMAFVTNHLLLILFARTVGSTLVALCARMTMVLAMVVASMLIMAIWTEVDAGLFWRILAALAIMDLLGTITTPLLARTISRGQPRTRASLG